MRYTLCAFTAAALIASAATAEEYRPVPGRQPQTLDAQLSRLQGQNPPPPSAYAPPSPAPVEAEYAPAGGEPYVPPGTGLLQQSESGIPYATGGVGDEELAELKALESRFSLKVLATLANGDFLGDSTLRVTDKGGNTVFEAPGNGPLFYVALPPGSYTVSVLRPDQPASSQKVAIGQSGVKALHFRWAGE